MSSPTILLISAMDCCKASNLEATVLDEEIFWNAWMAGVKSNVSRTGSDGDGTTVESTRVTFLCTVLAGV